MPVSVAFTVEQRTEIANIVEDNIGSNFQTRQDKWDGCVHLYAQAAPKGRIKHYEIYMDGTVRET